MRILHVVHQYPPEHVGGTELYTQGLARRQTADGHSVAVYYPAETDQTTDPDQTHPPARQEEGVRVYGSPLGRRTRTRVFLDSFARPRGGRPFSQVLAREAPDIVHIQHLMGLPATISRILTKAGIPYVVTLHDYWYGCANAQLVTNYDQTVCSGPDRWFFNCGRCALARAGRSGMSWLSPGLAPLMAFRNRLLHQVLARAKQVIAPTEFVRRSYEALGLPVDNMIVVPHGIDIPVQKVAKLREERRRPEGAPFHIGYVGSLGWQKGVHNLIAAVNQLPTDDFRLTVYGSPDNFPEYAAGLRESATHSGIRFGGRISRERLWSALAEWDVAVLPTLWYEASPLTIDEIFAVGVPIVASRIGAMTEKIRHEVDGLLVEPGDVAALRDALRRLHDDRPLRKRLEENIQPVRSLDQHMADVEAIYVGLLAAAP